MELIDIIRLIFMVMSLALIMMGINFVRLGRFFKNIYVLHCGIALILSSLASILIFIFPIGNTFYFGVLLFLIIFTYIDHSYREKRINHFLSENNIGASKLLSPILRL